jgi:hypothetical protein
VAADAAIEAQLASTPENVRNSPEFQAVEKKLRTTARQLGRSQAAEARARTAAETARQTAEVERQAALEAQLVDILGADGIATYQEIADLGATDPVAAARRFAELMAKGAQSAGQGAPDPNAPPAPPAGGAPVPAQTPPPPSGGVDGNAPLITAQGEDIAALTATLDKQFNDVVERNQNTTTRNRVTMRERAGAMIGFLGSAYVKAMNPPKRG